MAEITKLNTNGYYENKYHYSRLVMVDDWIFMANCGGVDPETGQLPPDPVDQAKWIVFHIERSLAAVGSNLTDVIRMVVNISKRENFFAIMDYLGPVFKGVEPARTMSCAPLGSEDLLVEVEITAYKGAGGMKQNRIQIGTAGVNRGFGENP